MTDFCSLYSSRTQGSLNFRLEELTIKATCKPWFLHFVIPGGFYAHNVLDEKLHCGWELIVIHVLQGSSPNHWINSPGSYRQNTEEQLKKQLLQLNHIFFWSILFSVMCMVISIWDGDTDTVVAAKSRVSWLEDQASLHFPVKICVFQNSFLLKYKSLLVLVCFFWMLPQRVIIFFHLWYRHSHFSLPTLEALNAQFNETNSSSRGWQEKIPSS